MNPEQIGLWAGFVFTLMVFSYILGDNFLYRLAIYVLVGLAAGFVSVVTVENVLLPWIRGTVFSGNVGAIVVGIIPLLLGLLLLFKISPRLGRIGNLAVAFIIGIGAAVALVGAITGTLIPLASATSGGVQVDALNGLLVVLGVVSSLVYFQYLAQRTPGGMIQPGLFVRFVSGIGQGFIVVTLGALYAAAILTSLTIFSERVSFLLGRIGGG